MTTLKTHHLTFTRLLVGTASLAIIIATMTLAAPYISPVLLALFLAILFTPILHWLRKRGLSTGLALLAMIIGVIVLGLALTWFLSASFEQLADSLSTYQAQFQAWVADAQATLASQDLEPSGIKRGAADIEEMVQSFVNYLSRLGNLAATAIFIVVTIIFALLEAPKLSSTLQQSLGEDHILVVRSADFSQSVVRYFGLRTLVNLITGGLVTIMLWVLGIDFALLWGVLTFFLSYVPYLGITLATIPAVLLAWAQYGIGMAIVVIIGVMIINGAAENVVAPKLIGQGLKVSPLVVFLSFMLWSWILGPLGMFLSMPLTVILMFLLDSFDSTRWVADLMVGSSKPPGDTGQEA
ncbi:MAG: AI-2E family transporter [Chloroflexi bacterium]|nr:AI-2E family transporter [Chloroflexota bacterium]